MYLTLATIRLDPDRSSRARSTQRDEVAAHEM
jgi:hypothetical protein